MCSTLGCSYSPSITSNRLRFYIRQVLSSQKLLNDSKFRDHQVGGRVESSFRTSVDILTPNTLHRHQNDIPHTLQTFIISYTCINSPTTTQQLKKSDDQSPPPLPHTQAHLHTKSTRKREKNEKEKRGWRESKTTKQGNTTTTRQDKAQKSNTRQKKNH